MLDRPEDSTEDLFACLRRLSDDELLARLKGLAGRERRATALLVAHIAELDTRDVHLRAGYSSLFLYCRDALALSDGEAYNRIEAARAARRFPVVVELLASGELSLTGARLLAPHLTAENHAAVLASARGQRKTGIEEIVASLSPRPDVPASVRKLPRQSIVGPATSPETGPTPSAGAGQGPSADADQTPGGSACVPPLTLFSAAASHSRAETAASRSTASARPRQRAEVQPLSPDRYRYQLTIGGATLEKLRLAKDMLRHAVPSGDDEVVLDRALTALLAELARKKFGARTKEARCSGGLLPPACAPGTPVPAAASEGSGWDGNGREEPAASSSLPVALERAAWVRDLGRCTFVAANGRRCEERALLLFHRTRPVASNTGVAVDDIELRCARHERDEIRHVSAGGAAPRASRVGMGAAARRHVQRKHNDKALLVPEQVGPGKAGPRVHAKLFDIP